MYWCVPCTYPYMTHGIILHYAYTIMYSVYTCVCVCASSRYPYMWENSLQITNCTLPYAYVCVCLHMGVYLLDILTSGKIITLTYAYAVRMCVCLGVCILENSLHVDKFLVHLPMHIAICSVCVSVYGCVY